MTGVTLRAGYNNNDWQVRDRRMNIFARDIPLSSLMNSIARVMKFKWSKSESDAGVLSYRLYMERKTLLGAESKRLMEEDRVRKRQIEGRQRFLSALDAAVGMSKEDLDQLQTQSPYVFNSANSPMGLLPRILADSPSAKQAFLSGEDFALDIDAISPETKQGLIERIGIKSATSGSIAISALAIPTFTEMEVWRGGASAPVIFPYVNTGMGAMRFQLKSAGESCTGAVGIEDPKSDLTELNLKYNDAIHRNDTSEIDRLASETTKVAKSEIIDLGEPLVEHSDDPDLSAKVKMNVEGHEFASALASLAYSSGFSVVSDSFDKSYLNLTYHDDQVEIRAVLDRLESVCRYNWERHGSILELHDRDWYRKRAAQVPEAWLEAWRKAFKDKGKLDIDEISQMTAALTMEQIIDNFWDDEILKQAQIGGWENRDLLRMYAALDKQQRAAILTDQGLSLDSLSGNGSPAVQAFLTRCSSPVRDSEGGLRLTGKRIKRDARTCYDLNVVTSSGDSAGIQWTVACPIYTPPIEEKPNDDKTQQSAGPSSKK